MRDGNVHKSNQNTQQPKDIAPSKKESTSNKVSLGHLSGNMITQLQRTAGNKMVGQGLKILFCRTLRTANKAKNGIPDITQDNFMARYEHYQKQLRDRAAKRALEENTVPDPEQEGDDSNKKRKVEDEKKEEKI